MRAALTLVVLFLAAPAVARTGPDVGAEASAPCLPHPLIDVSGDLGLDGVAVSSGAGAVVPRPGAGVVSGSGSTEDPFVIEGWCIGLPGEEAGQPAIRLAGTSAHVIIRDVRFAGDTLAAIALVDSSNVTILDMPAPFDLSAIRSTSLHVERATLTSADLGGVTGATITQTSFAAGRWTTTLSVHDSADVTVESSHFARGGTAISADRATHIAIENNSFEEFEYGISVRDADDLRIAGNSLLVGLPVDLNACDAAVVEWNVIDGGGHGIIVQGDGYVVANNTIERENVGIRSSGVGNVLRDNVVRNSTIGIHLDEATQNVLRRNRVWDGNLSITGHELAHWQHTIPRNNRIDGHPIRYLSNASNASAAIERRHVIVVGSREVVLPAGALAGNDELVIAYSSDVEVGAVALDEGAISVRSSQSVAFGNVSLVDTPFRVVDSAGVTLADATVEGQEVAAWRSTGVQVLRSDLSSWVEFYTVDGGDVRDSAFQGARVKLDSSTGTAVAGNVFTGPCTLAIDIFGSPETIVTNNLLDGCGIEVGMQAQYNSITRNTLIGPGSGTGIAMVRGGLGNEGTVVEANNITAFEVGVWATALTRVNGNNLGGNAFGVVTNGAVSSYDAKENWWGCSAGPGAAACAGVSGSIVVAPWRTSPNGAAGAR